MKQWIKQWYEQLLCYHEYKSAKDLSHCKLVFRCKECGKEVDKL